MSPTVTFSILSNFIATPEFSLLPSRPKIIFQAAYLVEIACFFVSRKNNFRNIRLGEIRYYLERAMTNLEQLISVDRKGLQNFLNPDFDVICSWLEEFEALPHRLPWKLLRWKFPQPKRH